MKDIMKQFKQSRWDEINRRTINGKNPRLSGKTLHDYLRKGTQLRMTKKEFCVWCDKHEDKIAALHAEQKTPTVDRIDSLGHYEVNNLRILSLKDNADAGRTARWNQTAKKHLPQETLNILIPYIKNKNKLRALKRRLYVAAKKELTRARPYFIDREETT